MSTGDARYLDGMLDQSVAAMQAEMRRRREGGEMSAADPEHVVAFAVTSEKAERSRADPPRPIQTRPTCADVQMTPADLRERTRGFVEMMGPAPDLRPGGITRMASLHGPAEEPPQPDSLVPVATLPIPDGPVVAMCVHGNLLCVATANMVRVFDMSPAPSPELFNP